MRAGNLRNRVILQKPEGVRDSVGERQTTWVDVATIWAQVSPFSTKEQFLAAQASASTSHRITMRYSSVYSAISASWRVLFGSRIFVIDGIRNIDERNIYLELICTESSREE